MSFGPLRLGFVSVIRPAFRGPSVAAAEASLAGLAALGRDLGFATVLADVASDVHTAGGAPLPSFAVHDAASAQRAALQLGELDLDLLLVQLTTFATGEVLAPLLQACERVGVWALPESGHGDRAGQAGRRGEGVDDRRGPLPLNSLCGLNMTLSYLDSPHLNERRPVRWYYGAAHSDWFRSRLGSTVAALRGLKALSSARVLQIGGVAPGFYGLEERLGLDGPTVDTVPLARLLERVAGVNAAEAAALADRQARAEAASVSREQLERSARVELALTALAREGHYDALAVRCWPELPAACGSMACAAMGNLAAVAGAGADPAAGGHERTGVPAACEGDVAGALSMLALQAVSGGSAVLLDLSDLDAEADELLFWHCGNAPLEWAAGGASRLTTHFNRTGLGTVRDMVLAAGPVTGFRLVGPDRALIVSGTFGSADKASYDGVRGWLGDLRWNGRRLGARAFVANVLDKRLAHHYAFGRGDLTNALRELCGWLGREPVAAPEVGGNGLA